MKNLEFCKKGRNVPIENNNRDGLFLQERKCGAMVLSKDLSPFHDLISETGSTFSTISLGRFLKVSQGAIF